MGLTKWKKGLGYALAAVLLVAATGYVIVRARPTPVVAEVPVTAAAVGESLPTSRPNATPTLNATPTPNAPLPAGRRIPHR